MRTPKSKNFCTTLGRLWLVTEKDVWEALDVAIRVLMLYNLRGENKSVTITLDLMRTHRWWKKFIPHAW